MVKGNIFLDEEGLKIQNVIANERISAVENFCVMREEAKKEGDIFHYKYDTSCSIYSIHYNSEDPHYKLIGQILLQRLKEAFGNFPNPVKSLDEFEAKSEPRTHGGYKYEKCPSSDYIYDKETINSWHAEWYFKHPEAIDWKKFNNDIWPRYDLTIEILKQELLKAGEDIPAKEKDIANCFHENIMKHLDERERISKAKKIGAAICEANYYHREVELEKLEAAHGNGQADLIYSIKKNDEFQFLSIDKQHGMLEWCDDKGNHQGEMRFDGSDNSRKEDDHSLQCVAEWKKKYKKYNK